MGAMNFLVCLDGSPRSLDVIPHATKLATATGAELVLVRVLDPRVDAAGVVAAELEPAVRQVEKEWAQSLVETLAASGARGKAVVVRREWGKEIADAIAAVADAEDVSLVALSSRGSGAVRHALLGSVAMGVVGRSTVPVLALGGHALPPAADRPGFHLLITSDGSPDARSVFEGVRPLLSAGGITVTLLEVMMLHLNETETAAKWRVTEGLVELRQRLPDGVETGIEVRMAAPGGGVDSAIVAAAKELGADAIAMATHGHSARRHLVAGSTALGVLGMAEAPVILVKSRPVD